MPARISASVDEFISQRFDFIVIGGGTAGLAVAARLAESGAFTVGVLEAGGVADGIEDIDIPGHYGRTLGGRFDWQFETTPQPGLGGRTLSWPRGKVLGGTSALNFMTWVRASREDYDAWEGLGNPGWGWDGLLPFFKKSETFHPPSDALRQQYDVRHDPNGFGTSGPIDVSYSTDYSPSHRLWHHTLNALGVETNPSHFTGSNIGVWTKVNTVDPRTATRSYSTGYCALPGSSLYILTGATVSEIIIDQLDCGLVATGVRFLCQGQEHAVSASREVILSAGSVQSPQILELSGIGNPKILLEAGIPVKVDSPRVGENLQEHLMLPLIVEVDPSLPSPDDLKKDEAYIIAAREQYAKDHTGPLTILPWSISYIPFANFMSQETLAALASKTDSFTAFSPEKQAILKDRLNGKAKLGQIEYIFDHGNWGKFRAEAGKNYGTLLQILQYPFSVGSIHIQTQQRNGTQSKPPRALGQGTLAIDPACYLGAHGKLDLEVMRECVRFAHSIVTTAPLSEIVRVPVDPTAAISSDKDQLEQWIIDNTITDWHPVGTCAMGGGAGIRDGVVDERLRVYGINGLRVVDASIMPLQISAHPQATIYAIAEKAAHMILEDTGTSSS